MKTRTSIRLRFAFGLPRFAMVVAILCVVTAARAEPLQPISDEQRLAIQKLPRELASARGDRAARTTVVDTAIELGPLGIERLLPLLKKEATGLLTRYSNAFISRAKQHADAADPATLIAEDENLQSLRAQVLESGELVVRLETATGTAAIPAEQQLQSAETQWLRTVQLGPLLSQLADGELSAMEQTNRQRTAHQLPPLQIDVKLCLAARDHSQDMAAHGFFSHTSPVVGKTTFVDRAQRFSTTAAAENIHAGSTTGAGAVTAWMNSEGHRANILSPKYRRFGVGLHDGHWTQMFGE